MMSARRSSSCSRAPTSSAPSPPWWTASSRASARSCLPRSSATWSRTSRCARLARLACVAGPPCPWSLPQLPTGLTGAACSAPPPALTLPPAPHAAPQVAQLAGYVAEHSAYHHGEQSLTSTIVGLAQDFVGSNNINLLVPSGQFGTRLQVRARCARPTAAAHRAHSVHCILAGPPCRPPPGLPFACLPATASLPAARPAQACTCVLPAAPQGGKDAASARYIYTRLAPLTRHLFNEADDRLLTYQNEEGQSIEPTWCVQQPRTRAARVPCAPARSA